mgnify:FL=1
MGFWKKIKMLVPLKHVMFILFMTAAMLAIAFYDSAEDIKVTIEPESVTIKATGYTMNIPYEMIESMELADMPKEGTIISGKDDLVVRYGNWENEAWGEYFICADLDATKCIVAHLDDGRVFVFSRKSNQETETIFENLQSYVGK